MGTTGKILAGALGESHECGEEEEEEEHAVLGMWSGESSGPLKQAACWSLMDR